MLKGIKGETSKKYIDEQRAPTSRQDPIKQSRLALEHEKTIRGKIFWTILVKLARYVTSVVMVTV